MILLTVYGPRCLLAGGSLVYSAAVLCGGMRLLPENTSTTAQGHVWDLAEYKRAGPAHVPTGATFGGAGGERKLLWAYHPGCFIMRARLVL
jgi:hypothetical protein